MKSIAVINYIGNGQLDGKPLTVQLDLIRKQIAHLAQQSKTKMTSDERLALVYAWDACNMLREQTYNRIEKIKNSFSLN
jgi:hypothetical protein